MSVELFTAVSEKLEYSINWKISNLTSHDSKSHQTPVFYPIPELGFSFEIWYQENSHQSSFKLTLNKEVCIDIPVELKMELKVVAYHYDENYIYGSSYKVNKEYTPKTAIIVKEMSSLGIVNSNLSPCGDFISFLKNGFLKCNMKFFGHLNLPLGNRSDSRMASNLDKFAENFYSIYSPSVLNDVQFKVENTTLNAHKSVLAAHSPVFLKMFTQDCLESKMNSVTIADTTYNNFERFLKYLYSGKIEDKSFPNLMDLFVLADKYDVRTLKRECAETTANLLSVENIFEVLIIVYGLPGQEMQATVKKFAATHIKLLQPDEKWNDLVKRYPAIAYEVLAEVYRISEN